MWTKKLIWMWLLALAPVLGYSQGNRYDNFVIDQNGHPVPGASIRVCVGQNITNIPCTPTASVYTDLALTIAKGNPLSPDSQGNFFFYAAGNQFYTIQITGTGVTTRTMTNQFLASTGGGGGSGCTTPCFNDGGNAFATSTPTIGNLNNKDLKLITNNVERARFLGAGGVTITGDLSITGLLSPLTTKGDLLGVNGSSQLVRRGVGTNGQVLVADSGQASGLGWLTLTNFAQFNPSAGAGLTLNIGPGTAICQRGNILTYAGGTKTMTNTATNYVSLATADSVCTASEIVTSTSPYTFATGRPLYRVIAAGGVITSIIDDRGAFVDPTLQLPLDTKGQLLGVSKTGMADPLIRPVPVSMADGECLKSDSGDDLGVSYGSCATALTLQTDGTPNGDQTLLNLAGGTGVTLADDGMGTVTITSTATGILLQTDGMSNADQTKLNLVSGTNITLSDDGMGAVTIDSAGGTGAGIIPFDGCAPELEIADGLSFWGLFGMTHYTNGHWEMTPESYVSCWVRVPSTPTVGPNVILEMTTPNNSGSDVTHMDSCDAKVTASGSFNPALSCAMSQTFTATGTAYQRQSQTYAIQTAAVVAGDFLLVRIFRASAANTITEAMWVWPYLEIQ